MNAISNVIQPGQYVTWPFKAKASGLFEHLLAISLGVAVFASSLGVVYLKHMGRNLNHQMQVLQQQGNELQLERSQLLVEYSTWAAPARIQGVSKWQWSMKLPEERDTIMVQM